MANTETVLGPCTQSGNGSGVLVLITVMLKCVSTGTLSDFIFYANIIRANHAVFFLLGKCFWFNPECVHSLAEPRSGSGGVSLSRHGCIYQDMVAVCLSSVYLDPGWIHDMF